MTNNDPITRTMIADAQARRIAALNADKAAFTPVTPGTARRLPPRPRRHSVRHRSIR